MVSSVSLQPKYIIVPGFIRSKNDGDIHYITTNKLIALYGLDRDECICVPRLSVPIKIPEQFSNLPVLRPLYSGKYREYIADLNKGSK